MTTSISGNTQNLIIAARALAARQKADFARHLAVTAAEQQNVKASQEIVEAELGAANAEVALATAKASRLVAQRRLSAAQLASQQIAPSLDTARHHLWNVCSSPDEQVIVAAAEAYGDCVQNFWLADKEIKRARTALEDAEFQIVRATDDLEVYNTAIRLAKEAQAWAAAAHQAAHRGIVHGHQPNGLFALEAAVTDAAFEMTGQVGEAVSCNGRYAYTHDLPVWQEMLANANNQKK